MSYWRLTFIVKFEDGFSCEQDYDLGVYNFHTAADVLTYSADARSFLSLAGLISNLGERLHGHCTISHRIYVVD